jgi:hypothetical protein
VAFHDTKSRGEALDILTDEDNFFYSKAYYIYWPRCQLLTCKNCVKGDNLPYTFDPLYDDDDDDDDNY